MIDPSKLALIHAEIDGELDEHERAQLARALLADPQLRALRDGLKHVCDTLEGMPAVEPPEQLRASILAALPAVDARPAPARRAAWGYSPALWRYAALFAGVLATGAVLYQAGIGRGPDANEVAGTMAGPGAQTSAMLDTVRLDIGQATGRASLYRSATGLDLELQLTAGAPVDVLIASGGQTQRLSGLGSAGSPGGPRTRVTLPEIGTGTQTVELTFLIAGRPIGAAQLKVPAGR